jgi:hypothetical protein
MVSGLLSQEREAHVTSPGRVDSIGTLAMCVDVERVSLLGFHPAVSAVVHNARVDPNKLAPSYG